MSYFLFRQKKCSFKKQNKTRFALFTKNSQYAHLPESSRGQRLHCPLIDSGMRWCFYLHLSLVQARELKVWMNSEPLAKPANLPSSPQGIERLRWAPLGETCQSGFFYYYLTSGTWTSLWAINLAVMLSVCQQRKTNSQTWPTDMKLKINTERVASWLVWVF